MFFIFSKEKRLVRIMLLALIIAWILISVSFYLIIIKKEKINGGMNQDLFKTTKYYCEYTMNVFSNKNQNLYKINEMYLCMDGDYIRMDFVEGIPKFSYIITPKSIGIKSEEQISSLILKDYNNKKLNLQSISTFFYLKNHMTDENIKKENCMMTETIQDGNIIYRININSNCVMVKEMLGENLNINSLELVVDKKSNLPLEYIVYTDNDKVYLDINYQKFEINSNFDMKVFDF